MYSMDQERAVGKGSVWENFYQWGNKYAAISHFAPNSTLNVMCRPATEITTLDSSKDIS